MKSYVKQMLRIPLQVVSIILLIMAVTVILVVGGNLWFISEKFLSSHGDDFITVGTVTQRPDTVKEAMVWDAEKEKYQIYKFSRYNRYIAEESLLFPEVSYILEPEKRVYWGSYGPEYLHVIETWPPMAGVLAVVEFSPKEDGIPDQSMKVEIKRVLGSDKSMEGDVVWLCDHTNPYPVELKADKTYIALLAEGYYVHGNKWEESGNTHIVREYQPGSCRATLYTADGHRVEDSIDIQDFYEVTEGFYDTEIGQRFLAVANSRDILFKTQPVVGTNSTNLLLPFYEGSAWVYEGRYPTVEEYSQGAAVCLAPRIFAENNELKVGDKITTRLYYTSMAEDVSWDFALNGGGIPFLLIGPDGKLLKPFEEKEYTIVGLYDYMPSVDGIGRDQLIVPLNSVHRKHENILGFGVMTSDNTSFQIENGTIADFMEVSARYNTDNLIFTFYDRGYSALVEGIENLRNISAALLVMGVIAAIVLSLQISHIYITKQKRQLSIERLMGMTRKRCRNISMAGILVLLISGTVPGMVVGMVLTDEIGISDTEQIVIEQAEGNNSGQADEALEEFSRKYSNLELAVEMDDIDLSIQNQGSLAVSGIMGCLVILLGMGLSDVKIRRVLRGEPLYLLEDSMAGRR